MGAQKWLSGKANEANKCGPGVAERLKLVRHLLNISEAEAADAMFITVKTYRKREGGERHRDNHFGIFNFCDKYGVSYGWLFGGDQYPAPPPRFRLRLVG
jgi:transcriptional regulator with XRE-family HTH domain